MLDDLVRSAAERVKPGAADQDLIDIALDAISTWDSDRKALFIAGHPRIGQVTNLSAFSAAEQASKAASPEVLARLENLNDRYERSYPGLRYITFVNGRTRAQIADEMDQKLGESSDPDVVHEAGSEEWNKELERAIVDIGLIAESRSKALGRSSK